jgi:hypothetical protein
MVTKDVIIFKYEDDRKCPVELPTARTLSGYKPHSGRSRIPSLAATTNTMKATLGSRARSLKALWNSYGVTVAIDVGLEIAANLDVCGSVCTPRLLRRCIDSDSD